MVAQRDEPAPWRQDLSFKRLWASLLWLGVGGMVLGAWLAYYTSWLPHYLVVLSGGGLAGVIAFLTDLLRNDRKKQLRRFIEDAVLTRSDRVRAGVQLLFLLLIGATAATTTIIFDTAAATRARGLWIGERPPIEGPVRPGPDVLLKKESRLKLVLWGGGPFRLKVAGLPALTLEAHPVARTRVDVPSSFLTPIVLVQPTLLLQRAASPQNELALTLELEGPQQGQRTLIRHFSPYLGAAVCIGEVDDEYLDSKRSDGTRVEVLEVPERRLVPGELLFVRLSNRYGGPYGEEVEVTVQRVLLPEGIVQKVEIDVPG